MIMSFFDKLFGDPVADLRNQITSLQADINDIKKWRNETADPTLNSNIQNIKTLFDNLQNNILPRIQLAEQTTEDNKNISLNAASLANEAQQKAASIFNDVQIAKTDALDAKNGAENAFFNVSELQKQFMFASDGISNDLDIVKNKGNVFITVLKRELTAISDQINEFGKDISNSAKDIQNKLIAVGGEFTEAVEQISEPLQEVISYAQKLPKIADGLGVDDIDDIAYLPYNLYQMAKYTYWASITDKDGHDILHELLECFGEITDRFNDLGGSFVDFGKTIASGAENLNNRVAISQQLIDSSFNDFMNAFQKVFFNMTYYFKGENPPA